MEISAHATASEIMQGQRDAAAARDRLAAGEQLTDRDLPLLTPAEVSDAVERGQGADYGIPPRRRTR